MLLADLVATSQRVAATRSRLEKIGHLTECLRALEPHEIEIGVAYLVGELPQGRIGLGMAALQRSMPAAASARASLTLARVHDAFERIKQISGAGSTAERVRVLSALIALAIGDEQRFLARLVIGELRQGALEGIMVEAVARATGIDSARVRRAVMLAGETRSVAQAALGEGAAGLERFALRVLQPLKPMLSDSADDVADALSRLGRASLEYKLDGARVQLHKVGDEVRVFTRRLKEVTAAVPELVESARRWPVRSVILDGETLAVRADGRPHPFQTTMRRFGRKLDIESMREQLPLEVWYFDCLHADGEDLLDRPAAERFEALSASLPAQQIIPRLVTAHAAQGETFYQRALDEGHEGIMAKALDAGYAAGRRGSAWLKIKHTHSLDLVVLAAEWGHGRRRGWLSNLHLGARDAPSREFVMLGKTFKGLTDEMLAWQTERLQALEIRRDRYTVYVKPEQVVEIAFNEIQTSPHYPGGLALRFARVKGYRNDKGAAEADTIDTVRAIHQRTHS